MRHLQEVTWTVDELIAFEDDIAARFERGEAKGPIHLSNGNERELIDIFKDVGHEDWCFGTWRSHYHALLKGVPPDLLRSEIISGRSLNLKFPEYRFFTSAIVGGILPIAVGVAASIKRKGEDRKVWAFVGDMTASIGAFHDAVQYADGNELPIRFIVENNGHSVYTPTAEAWGFEPCHNDGLRVSRYHYRSKYPHWAVKHGKSF